MEDGGRGVGEMGARGEMGTRDEKGARRARNNA